MAKTITEYEASDIDLDNDPLHKTLFANVLGAMLLGSMKPKEGEEPMVNMKKAVAFFLTGLERDGYVVTKREDIPKDFIAPWD